MSILKTNMSGSFPMALRKRTMLVAAIAAALVLGGCEKSRKPPVQRTGPSVVFLGDSLTAGLGLPDDQTFPALVEQKMIQEGLPYRVINAGRSGDTTAGGLSRLPWYLRKEVEMRVLVIELGNNDAMRGQSVSSIEKNITEIIRKTRAYDPSVQILLCELKTFPNLGRDYGTQFAAVFPRVSKKEKVPLLPFILEGVGGHPDLNQQDGIHPNEAGSKIVADNVYAAIRPYLKAPSANR